MRVAPGFPLVTQARRHDAAEPTSYLRGGDRTGWLGM
jgi:hypothetical protein